MDRVSHPGPGRAVFRPNGCGSVELIDGTDFFGHGRCHHREATNRDRVHLRNRGLPSYLNRREPDPKTDRDRERTTATATATTTAKGTTEASRIPRRSRLRIQ
jgi:hypothetical protein